MNALFPRFLKSIYRKEPIASFVLIVGAVDMVIGGASGKWTLLSFGTMTAIAAIFLRWWQVNKAQAIVANNSPRRLLPPSSSRPPLPMLIDEKRRQ